MNHPGQVPSLPSLDFSGSQDHYIRYRCSVSVNLPLLTNPTWWFCPGTQDTVYCALDVSHKTKLWVGRSLPKRHSNYSPFRYRGST